MNQDVPLTEEETKEALEKSLDAFQQYFAYLEKSRFTNHLCEFTREEMIRFGSISGTILDFLKYAHNPAFIRQITYPMIRSIIEGAFLLMYIHWEDQERQKRFDELLDDFRTQYRKSYNDNPHAKHLPPPLAEWGQIDKELKIANIIGVLRNCTGESFRHLYPIYRVVSFDTHAKASPTLLEATLGKPPNNKPYDFFSIDPEKAIRFIAWYYSELVVTYLQKNCK